MDNLSNPPDKLLERVFQATSYRVLEPAFSIRIGNRHPELDAWLAKQGKTSWAFISACNPAVQPQPPGTNLQLHENFRALLLRENRTHFEGLGIGDNPGWPPEASFLIPGISLEEAISLACFWNQRALVYGESGNPARLIWCYPG